MPSSPQTPAKLAEFALFPVDPATHPEGLVDLGNQVSTVEYSKYRVFKKKYPSTANALQIRKENRRFFQGLTLEKLLKKM